MNYDWRIENVEDLESFDPDKVREELRKRESPDSVYPMLCGSLQYKYREAVRIARNLLDELIKVDRKREALTWAAEWVLEDSRIETHNGDDVFQLLYDAAAVIENAMESGWDADQIRERVRQPYRDDELLEGRFIDQVERCEDCDEFCGKENKLCPSCQEERLEGSAV